MPGGYSRPPILRASAPAYAGPAPRFQVNQAPPDDAGTCPRKSICRARTSPCPRASCPACPNRCASRRLCPRDSACYLTWPLYRVSCGGAASETLGRHATERVLLAAGQQEVLGSPGLVFQPQALSSLSVTAYRRVYPAGTRLCAPNGARKGCVGGVPPVAVAQGGERRGREAGQRHGRTPTQLEC